MKIPIATGWRTFEIGIFHVSCGGDSKSPAYYYGDGKDDFVVAENQEKALELAREASLNPGLQMQDLRQDADVLDTWFSSWLWPISVFDGIRNPENKEINYYYPTNDLVTGPDILFFWVARMIVAGYAFKDTRPFNNVYLTGLVRDKQRRKCPSN